MLASDSINFKLGVAAVVNDTMLRDGTGLWCVVRASQFLVPRTRVSQYRDGLHSFQRPISTSQTRSSTHALRSSARLISTLRRESLTTGDYLDLSNRQSVRFNIPQEVATLGQSTLGLADYGSIGLRYHSIGPRHTPFPDGTRGFLYYFLPPFAPPIAGQLRFRITPSQDPSSFSSGYDLRHTISTLPMSWSLRQLVSSEQRHRLASLLLHDGLVTSEVLADVIKMVRMKNKASAANLYALGQPFYFDLQTTISDFYILAAVDGKNVAERALVTFPAHTVQNYFHGRKYPYTGSALCCFVQATPDRICIQVLKILQEFKVTYPDPELERAFALPQEGELLPTRRCTWSYRILTQEALSSGCRPDRRQPLRLLKDCSGVTWNMF